MLNLEFSATIKINITVAVGNANWDKINLFILCKNISPSNTSTWVLKQQMFWNLEEAFYPSNNWSIPPLVRIYKSNLPQV